MSGSLHQRCAVLYLLLLTFFTATLTAQNTSAASTFYLPKTETQFSFNLANDSNDVFVYLTSPAYSWVGVGFGHGMKNALMLVVYANAKGDNITASPRIATGHSEPTFSPDVKLDMLPGTGVSDGMFVLKALCRSCRVWPNGFLDADSTAQPMLYAFGPAKNLNSDRPDAPLKRHYNYGTFSMNMREATGKGGVPAPSSQSSGVSSESPLVRDRDSKSLAHAIMGCLAIFVLWPINIILAGFLRNIKIHIGFSTFIMVCLIMSYALGIATSGQYNRSKAFTSPHQIFAFLAILPMTLISVLPMKRIASLKSWIPRLHAPLTSLTLTLLILTGGLGLHLSSSSTPIILTYLAVSILVFSFIALIQLCVRRRGSAYARASTRRRLGDEDEQDYGLAEYWARRKLEGSRSQSQASSNVTWEEEQQRRRPKSQESQSRGVFGGGTMPGPHYMMNMHPGVPVTFK
ncbi:iron reductase domain protein [Periconia macrospinosa]|uniref:Iron reductase domain protein n=1 Tax=Periconia macrospinosa TaxID=97972 RepID=A0A2V1DM29_9PLEO|nr:iron reductase domain protein [Periconia macrospinosa]